YIFKVKFQLNSVSITTMLNEQVRGTYHELFTCQLISITRKLDGCYLHSYQGENAWPRSLERTAVTCVSARPEATASLAVRVAATQPWRSETTPSPEEAATTSSMVMAATTR